MKRINVRTVFQFLFLGALTTVFFSCNGSAGPTPVTIDLSGAQSLFTVLQGTSSSGLTLKDTSSEEALGQLRKILADGTIQPVIYQDDNGQKVAAKVVPSQVFVGPDDKVYITFLNRGVLVGGKQCYLVRGTTGGPLECIGPDNGFNTFNGSTSNPTEAFNKNPPASQFDASNNFYYLADYHNPWSLKKLSPTGVITDFLKMNDEVGVAGFNVAPDGTIIFSGTTPSTLNTFLRKTTPAGGVVNLPGINFLENLLIAASGDIFSGLTRLPASTGWTTSESIILPMLTVDNNQQALVTSAGGGEDSSLLHDSFLEDTSGNVYEVIGDSAKRMYRVYPGTPVAVSPATDKVTFSRTSGNLLYYAGTDSSNKNIFRRIDLTDPTFPETDLLKGADIEVYRFQVWSTGNILFGGLRLSDNQLIIGEIDGKTLDITVKTTTTTRIDELVLIQ